MPTGLLGAIVAAILAATMSTHSGAINSLAAATTYDLVLPLTRRTLSGESLLRLARRLSLVWGVLLTVGALLFRQNGTPVVAVALSIASFTYGGLLGGFLLGMLSSRAIQRDAITGMAVGIAAMSLVVFATPIAAHLPLLAPVLAPLGSIAWPWYVAIGTTLTLTVGTLSSWSHPMPVPEASP
jgi:Na+/proline symporter